jgi:hypothetical protein
MEGWAIGGNKSWFEGQLSAAQKFEKVQTFLF